VTRACTTDGRMSEHPIRCGILFDPDPLDRLSNLVRIPASNFSRICTMDLLADTRLRAHAVVPSNSYVGGPRAATNVSATRVASLVEAVRTGFRMGSKGGSRGAALSRRRHRRSHRSAGCPGRGSETAKSSTANREHRWPYLGQAHPRRQDRDAGAPFGPVALSGDGGAVAAKLTQGYPLPGRAGAGL